MPQISRQLNQYTNMNMINNVASNKKLSNVATNRQSPVVSQKASRGMPNNFIVPQDERTNELSKTFDDRTLKQMGAIECSTCANRTYQDGSDDPGVSFQAPTHLSPAQAATAVMSHEQEHVTNERADALEEGREVISQSVQIFRDTCPECGTSYVSGGVTKTTTSGPSEPYSKVNDTNSEGNLLDYSL